MGMHINLHTSSDKDLTILPARLCPWSAGIVRRSFSWSKSSVIFPSSFAAHRYELKKTHNLRVVSEVLFGAEWGLQPGRQHLSSERLLQSGSGGRPVYKVLVRGEFNTMKYSFYKRFFCSSWGSDVTMKGFSASLNMRRCKDWDHKICS